MHIKVLGPMTKQCELLLQNAAIAAKKLKCHAEFERVNDLRRVVATELWPYQLWLLMKKLLQAAVCCLLKK